MPNAVEGLLGVYENMIDVLLVLGVFLTKDSKVEDLFCGASSCFRLHSVQYDPQHDFARMADEADQSVGLALLQVAFLGKCDARSCRRLSRVQ